jgi:hypothetical protein
LAENKLIESYILCPYQQQAFRPVPQRVNFLVEQASCLFLKMMKRLSATGFPACSTKSEFSCGTSILPVLENDETVCGTTSTQ